jgi:hypothetical protein
MPTPRPLRPPCTRSRLAVFAGATSLWWVLAGGCTDPKAGADAGADAGDASDAGDAADSEVDAELGPGQICFPGTAKACIIEGGKQALICNASGTNYVEGICKGPDGRDSQCIQDRCTVCFPGTQRCNGEEEVQTCAEDGSAWETTTFCNGGTTGQVCALDLTGAPCESLCSVNIKFNSYIGCDYWGVDLDNAFVPGGNEQGFYDAAGAQYAIVVANPPASPLPAIVEVWLREGGVEQKVPFVLEPAADPTQKPTQVAIPTEPLMPGQLRVFRLPRRDVNGTTQASLAYRVTASVPVIAYQFNPLENENVFSNDASLLLPATLLGREYFVMTREQTFDTLRCSLTVAAVLPGITTVSVQVSAPTLAGQVYPGAPNQQAIPHMEPGDTRVFKLEQYDVLNIETDRPGADLTGSRILSDQRVAVFGGSEAANAPNTARCVDIDPISKKGVCEYDRKTSCKTLSDCVSAGFNTCCADHLEQQIYPVKVWGSSYVASKSWDRGKESDIWRIMAGADNTVVLLTPPQPGIEIPVLQRGEWFEFESRQHFEIHTAGQKPILVGQFLAAQDAPEPNTTGQNQNGDAGTGDPAFMLAIPIEQYRRDLVVFTPAEYADNYVNITTLTGAEVTIDGELIPPGFFEVIGTGTYSVYRTRIATPGPHTITSTEPAGVIVYGYDQFVSYGYTGGLDLSEINTETQFGGGAAAP